jgi:hypothetical protein
VSNERRENSVRPAADVLEGDVGDVEARLLEFVSDTIQLVADSVFFVCTYGMLEALFFIVLSVTLSNRDTVIDIVQPHAIVGHVSDRAGTTASLEVCRLLVECVRPNLDASALGGVVHGDVADEDVLHDVDTLGVLSERSNGDAVCAIARQVLDKNVGSVWLE